MIEPSAPPVSCDLVDFGYGKILPDLKVGKGGAECGHDLLGTRRPSIDSAPVAPEQAVVSCCHVRDLSETLLGLRVGRIAPVVEEDIDLLSMSIDLIAIQHSSSFKRLIDAFPSYLRQHRPAECSLYRRIRAPNLPEAALGSIQAGWW